jgi:hypothetical protein
MFIASVAVVLAGAFRGDNFTSAEFHRALVSPLQAAGLRVDVYVAGQAALQANWTEWVGTAANSVTFVALKEGAARRHLNDSHFFCTCDTWCVNYPMHIHEQYRGLEESWAAVTASGVSYDYAIKARNDLIYHPRQAFKPCWLLELPADAVLANDVELQLAPLGHRWNEAGGRKFAHAPEAVFPTYMSDQLLAGTTAAMAHLFVLDGVAPPPGGRWEVPGRSEACPKIPWNIESVVARQFWDNGVGAYPVSLQLRKLGLQLQDVYEDWLRVPCRACYDCVNHS